MKKLLTVVLAVVVLVPFGTGFSGVAYARNEGWAAAGGFLGGLVLGSVMRDGYYCGGYYGGGYYSRPRYYSEPVYYAEPAYYTRPSYHVDTVYVEPSYYYRGYSRGYYPRRYRRSRREYCY